MNESRTAGACKAFFAKHNSRLDLDGIVQEHMRNESTELREDSQPALASLKNLISISRL